jgi:pyruvate-formate lyase-activating enzyme
MAQEKSSAICALREQGLSAGSCAVSVDGKNALACQATLRERNSNVERLIFADVLSLYIPGVVETDQLEAIAAHLARVDREILFTLLAFFREYQMKKYRSPTLGEMVDTFQAVKAAGLKNVRLGNTGVFAHTEDQIQTLRQKVGMGHF